MRGFSPSKGGFSSGRGEVEGESIHTAVVPDPHSAIPTGVGKKEERRRRGGCVDQLRWGSLGVSLRRLYQTEQSSGYPS